jgi:site-specific recombinase XerD
MTWTNYWAQKGYQPQQKPMNNQYLTWLQEKNLSPTTIRCYLDTLAKFNQSFTTQGLKSYFLQNQKTYQPTTLKTKQYALNSYLKFKHLKVEWEKIARLIPKVQKKFFSTLKEEELARLKQAKVEKNPQVYQRNNLLLDFLFYSGVRINELVNIRHQDWHHNQLKVHGKGNKVRFIFLPNFLIKHINPSTPGYLFTNQRGNQIQAEYIRWLLKERTRQAQLSKNITPHTFRRSFATLLYQKGAQLMTIQKLLGHSSVQTTEGYIHNSWDYLYGDYSRLWRKPNKEICHG